MTNEEKDRLHKAADEYAKRFSPWLYSYIMEIFVDGAEWQKKQTIDKACEWLLNHNNYQRVLDNGCGTKFDMTQCVMDFRKAMEE